VIEVDAITQLIKHRSHMHASLSAYGSMGFDEPAIYAHVTAALQMCVGVPSFNTGVADVGNTYAPRAALTRTGFALPFDAFSIVERDADRTFVVVVTRDCSRAGEDELDAVYVTAFAAQANRNNWVLTGPPARIVLIDVAEDYQAAYNIGWIGTAGLDADKVLSALTKSSGATAERLTEATVSLLCDNLAKINTPNTACAFKPQTEKHSLIKVASSKKPLWEYRVVEINAVRAIPLPHKGGTHATPRWHQVRGFWRTSKKGVKHFVHSFSRGDRSIGTVEHDYELA